jgi:uroporphyrinogen decarboxylase
VSEAEANKATAHFGGLRVGAFESRRAEEIARLIERTGGVPSVSPSLREVGLESNPDAVDFANRVIHGEIDIVILMTGVGTRHLVAQIERHVDKQRFIDALSDVTTIVRGPKPLAVLREWGIAPKHRAPEPNTWREVLGVIDAGVPVAGQTVGVQEYGKPNVSLTAGLEARGANVRTVKVYGYDFPTDTGPLEANIRKLAAGELDVVMFTSAHQVINLLRMAEQMGLGDVVREGLDRTIVASIGPTTSESLDDNDVRVDIEPQHGKMGHLVQAAAEHAPKLIARRKAGGKLTRFAGSSSSAPTPSTRSTTMIANVKTQTAEALQAAADKNAPWYDTPFMKACRREPCERTPVWLMRQAGRYMQEYREVRAKTTFLELCKNPAMCAEVMVTAVNRLGVDAAIIFSDLLPMLEPMGVDLEFAQGEGPVIHNPVREARDVERIDELRTLEELEFVVETVRQTRAGMPGHIPVIGFAGAPFTLASYIIEGGGSRNYVHTKALMYREPKAWDELMTKLAKSITKYLNGQIASGAQAVQLFDSWVGCLGPDDYRKYVLPYVRWIIQGITPGTPVLNFGTGNPALLPLYAEAGGAVIGVDWRVRLDEAWATVGYDRGVQGNLDPLVLLSTPDHIRERARDVLKQAGGRPGHIFNLGHGIYQHTPVDNVIALVEAVHEHRNS